ncbi:gliding motility-associated C-terminal domain-containing protein [Flavilitoribacter nigricans]|nr:gliding motility-associated C-terminal domain-containing protein [Flavilitoribacter nigricans]
MRNILLTALCTLFTTGLTAADYFWIGGSGNWSDISHWATSSGGILTHDQVPTADDDVYFDGNSFTGPDQVVTINNENIFCRALDWTGATGNPVLRGTAGKVINIFGSLHFITGMVLDFAGEFRFRSANPDTPVQTADHFLGKSVVFNGSGGWRLDGTVVVDSAIVMNDGHLNTNSQDLTADFLHIRIQNSGSLTLGDSHITLNGRNQYFATNDNLYAIFVMEVRVHGSSFSVDPGNSLIECTSNEVQVDIESTDPLIFNDFLFSNSNGAAALVQGYDPVSYGEIRFNSSARVDFTMSAEHLILTPGKTYDFLSSHTYNIQQITANGNCLGTITIQARIGNDGPTIFRSDGEAIEIDYVNLKGITATGTSNYTANNSVDLGGNSGWVINARSVNNLYWVGDSGNWNDPAHWSLTSGGPGGACVPSGTDNVFFDANSFTQPGQTVRIEVENAFCRDIDWSGAQFFPRLESDYEPWLHIYGSMTQIREMNFGYLGQVHFESPEPGKTITTANHQINTLAFNGPGGQWTLQDSLKVETYIDFQAGTLTTNDQYVECKEFFSSGNNILRRLELGNSLWVIKHFPDVDKDRWNVNLNGNFELDAGTSTIEFRGINGFFEHLGPKTLNYHRVLFTRNRGHLLHYTSGANIIIDSLEFTDGAYFSDDFTINTVIFAPGFSYFFESGTTQNIGNIAAPGDCNGLITLQANFAGNAAFFNIPNDHNLQYLSLKDMHNTGGGQLTAQNSIDLGNNQGWTINELSSRTLYWVGGNGDWADPAHWSLTSGGTGGACIPSLLDDVIFDTNSFTGPNQQVVGQKLDFHYCHDITWTDNLPNPTITLNQLYVYGSGRFSASMVNQVYGFHMSGSGAQTLLTNGRSFQDVVIENEGECTLLDGLSANQLLLESGALNTNDQRLVLGRLEMFNSDNLFTLSLGNSTITISEPTVVDFYEYYSIEAPFGNNTVINPGTSIIELLHPNAGMLLSGGLHFNNVVFSGTEGLINICHRENSSNINNPANFNLLEIGGDANVKGYHNIDSLLLAPGKSYRFEHHVTQTVNEYFLVLGNNCNPIELFSTLPGEKATFSMPAAAVVNGDFIQMQDQIGTGGASFFAGSHSTNIGNSNQGWIFDSRPDFVEVGFFGKDRSICTGDVLSLSAYNYSPGETYEWSTGSSEAAIPVTEADTYWARVTFGNMCQIIDSITISTINPATVDLGPDVGICEDQNQLLDATVNDAGITYRWQDGSSEPTFTVTQAGTYFVHLDRSGCISSDTIELFALPTPMVDLGPDQTLCAGETLTLDATASAAATYNWQDGSDQPQLTVGQSGSYAVSVTSDGCTGQDEVTLTFTPLPQFSLGPDTTLCSGETLAFDFSGTGDTYRWQDNADTPVYSIDQAGQYMLSITRNGCAATDALNVSVSQTPTVDLGPDLALCEGETTTLNAPTGAGNTYRWQDGSTTSFLTVEQSGSYAVSVTANGCTGQDEISLTFTPLPQFSLGPDTSLCSGETLAFDFSGVGDTYRWQDNSDAPAYTIDQTGQYTLAITSNGCAATDEINVNFFETPTVDLGPDLALCEGETTTLNAPMAAGNTYRWQDGSTTSFLTVDQSGSYAVSVTANGCTGQDEISLTFTPLPQFSLGPDTTLCSGEALLFDFSGVGDTYRWQDNSDAPVYNIDRSGQYALSITRNGCSTTDELNVTVSPTPDVDLGPDLALCEGETTTLFAPGNAGFTYRWQDGSTLSSFTVDQSGDYAVSVTADGCTGQDNVSITVTPLPRFDLGPDRNLCPEETINFDLGGLGDEYRWQDGNTSPNYTITEGGAYTLALSAAGCRYADTVVITAVAAPTVDLGADISICSGESALLEASVSQSDELFWQDGSMGLSLLAEQTGIYWLEATLGDCVTRDSISVTIQESLDLGLADSLVLCRSETITLRPNIGTGSIRWQDGSTDPEYTVREAGLYTAIVEQAGCETTASVIVSSSSCGQIQVFVPNVFSPNEDGLNDLFVPNLDPAYNVTNYQLKVFNRWGRLVFQSQSPGLGWDGRDNGLPAPSSVYVFMLEVSFEEQGEQFRQQFAGDVSLLR